MTSVNCSFKNAWVPSDGPTWFTADENALGCIQHEPSRRQSRGAKQEAKDANIRSSLLLREQQCVTSHKAQLVGSQLY